jgi:tRNA(Ile)-lysidine synthase
MAGMAGQGPFAIAVSGGADSMALLHLATDWCRRHEEPLPKAVTVDHGLRDASAGEALRVGAWAQAIGIGHTILAWNASPITSNLQSQAREARYRLIAEWMQRNGLTHVLTGHTQDDQAETFLIRLARGSGLEGLTGMSPNAPFPLPEFSTLELVRPLLGVSHEALVATLKALGQEWIEDPSNANTRFQRARLRAFAPALAQVGISADRITDAMAHLRRANEVIRDAAAELTAGAVTFERWGYALLAPDAFATAHREVSLRVLARVLRHIGGAVYPPEFDQTSGVLDWMLSREGPRGRTLGGCRLARREDGLLPAAREEETLLAEAPCMPIASGQTLVWDRRFDVSLGKVDGEERLEVRPLGLEGLRAVGGRVNLPPVEPSRIGRTLPAIWCADRLVCAPLLGFHVGVSANARFLSDNRLRKPPFSGGAPTK